MHATFFAAAKALIILTKLVYLCCSRFPEMVKEELRMALRKLNSQLPPRERENWQHPFLSVFIGVCVKCKFQYY